MCVCACVCMCVCVSTRFLAVWHLLCVGWVRFHNQSWKHGSHNIKHTHTHTHTIVNVGTDTDAHAHKHTHDHTRRRRHTCICIHMYLFVHTRTHTHAHICLNGNAYWLSHTISACNYTVSYHIVTQGERRLKEILRWTVKGDAPWHAEMVQYTHSQTHTRMIPLLHLYTLSSNLTFPSTLFPSPSPLLLFPYPLPSPSSFLSLPSRQRISDATDVW